MPLFCSCWLLLFFFFSSQPVLCHPKNSGLQNSSGLVNIHSYLLLHNQVTDKEVQLPRFPRLGIREEPSLTYGIGKTTYVSKAFYVFIQQKLIFTPVILNSEKQSLNYPMKKLTSNLLKLHLFLFKLFVMKKACEIRKFESEFCSICLVRCFVVCNSRFCFQQRRWQKQLSLLKS